MNFIASLPTSRAAWLTLAASAFILEICALFFQYFLNLAPCIMCIYQRTAVLGLVFCAVSAINPHQVLLRVFGYLCWAVSAFWGWSIANEHIAMQQNTNPFAFSCEIVPNFPSFMPLHQWIPSFFEATGDCGQISWSFLGMSMPGWMQVIFALYSMAFVLVLMTRLLVKKSL